jgi:hypothetical protein
MSGRSIYKIYIVVQARFWAAQALVRLFSARVFQARSLLSIGNGSGPLCLPSRCSGAGRGSLCVCSISS